MKGGNKNSGRRAVIDMRPDKQEIIKDIVLGRRTLTEIAKRIGVDLTTIQRYRDNKITEEMRRAIMAEQRIRQVEVETEIVNEDRMDVANTYEALARRVERLISKAEQNEDDAFALAAMEGLRKVLRDIATMQGKLATALTVNVTLTDDGVVVYASTPAGRNNFFARLFLDSKPGDNVHRITVPGTSIPRLAGRVERLRQQLSATRFRQEVLGEFLADGQSYFDLSIIESATSEVQAVCPRI